MRAIFVGESNNHKHPWLSCQHPRKPGPRWGAVFDSLTNNGTRSNDQQAPQRSLAHFRGCTSLCLPPLECCKGVSPTQAAKSRPLLKAFAGGANAATAVAVTGPTPGMVVRRRTSLSLAACGLQLRAQIVWAKRTTSP